MPLINEPYRAIAAVSLLECGGLKPILPFLGGRSDAARRYPPSRRFLLIISRQTLSPEWMAIRTQWHALMGVIGIRAVQRGELIGNPDFSISENLPTLAR